MKRFVLISCVSKKLASRAPAQNIYLSPLFRLNLRYAQSFSPNAIYILSAKHGMLRLDEMIEPYDLTLNDMKSGERKEWARKVLDQLRSVSEFKNDHFIILAGQKYRQYLTSELSHVEVPMEGLGIGQQLQFLKRKLG